MGEDEFPVHSSVTVHAAKTIYRSDDWWKAALTHSYGDDDPGIAIYLWHQDDDWSRKNKYHVKTADAWRSDKQLIEQYLAEDGVAVTSQDDFPVSDYYHISQGETVFQTDDWWKAIIAVDQKGSYETHEVMLYLWKKVDGDWRRRQKYAIKNLDDWSDDRDAVNSLLELDDDGEPAEIHSVTRVTTAGSGPAGEDASPHEEDQILSALQDDFKELHLGSGAGEGS
jgi:hypothetical protein